MSIRWHKPLSKIWIRYLNSTGYCISNHIRSSKFIKTVKSNSDEKSIVILLKLNGQKSVILVEPEDFFDAMVFNLGDFSNARCQQHFQALIRKVKLSLVNQVDEFGFYNVVLPKNFTKFRLQYFPSQNRFLVVSKFRLIFEDAKIFDRFSSTFIQNFPNSKNKWIRKIINGTREPEMVVYRDEDFVLVDNKRKRKKVSGLCYMALVTRCDLRCLRDLTADHIPLLENILFKGSKFLCDRHKIPRSRLLVYFHYPATYTHLHVHFRELCDFHSFQIHPLTSPLASHQFPAGSRCVFLEEVIANLRLMSDFYQHSTLPLFLTTQFEWLKVFNKL